MHGCRCGSCCYTHNTDFRTCQHFEVKPGRLDCGSPFEVPKPNFCPGNLWDTQAQFTIAKHILRLPNLHGCDWTHTHALHTPTMHNRIFCVYGSTTPQPLTAWYNYACAMGDCIVMTSHAILVHQQSSQQTLNDQKC